MKRDELVSLSKLLSLMLRHQPTKFGLDLDAEGYAPIDEVLLQVRRSFAEASVEDIRTVIDTIEPDKRRFTLEGDDIRANYGHSISERIAHQSAQPPDKLWHGTHVAALDSILLNGLSPMKRQYVHLTPDRELARRVGGRRGLPVLVAVDAMSAYRQGLQFYRANEAFWLVDRMPAEYLTRVG